MYKLLIVEDDTDILNMYTRVFENAQYEVETATDGEMALNKIREREFDMVLLDIMLPKMTGIDVLKKMREEGCKAIDTPVYLITNLGQENYVAECISLGASGYLLKARYNPKDIVDEINSFLQNNRSAV